VKKHGSGDCGWKTRTTCVLILRKFREALAHIQHRAATSGLTTQAKENRPAP